MVFCQLLSLALLGTAYAQCDGYRVYMSGSLTNQAQPVYFACKDDFTLYASQDVVTYYYTFASTNESDPRVRVYARVPNMPAGNNSYGAFGVQHANHSDLYMWGRQHNGVVRQEWEVIQMSRSAGGTHTFTPSNVNEVTFSEPAAARDTEINRLEIMFILPTEPLNYIFTAAVGEYGNSDAHGRRLQARSPYNDGGSSRRPAMRLPPRGTARRAYCIRPDLESKHAKVGHHEVLEIENFAVTVHCATGYSGTLTATQCNENKTPYTINGICTLDDCKNSMGTHENGADCQCGEKTCNSSSGLFCHVWAVTSECSPRAKEEHWWGAGCGATASPIREFNASQAMDCTNACRDNKDCEFYTWYRTNRSCALMHDCPTGVWKRTNNEFFSGTILKTTNVANNRTARHLTIEKVLNAESRHEGEHRI